MGVERFQRDWRRHCTAEHAESAEDAETTHDQWHVATVERGRGAGLLLRRDKGGVGFLLVMILHP